MDVPRLHFTGQFRADVNTRNNVNCNFDLNNTIDPTGEWNFRGTEDFEFINTRITSVIDKNGNEDTSSELLGAEVFTNENQSFAKIVDLDVDFQVSSLFGLRFGLKHKGTVLFIGNYTPCVIVHDMWERVRCTKYSAPPISILFGVQSTSKVVDIEWSNSTIISGFKSEGNELQVSITLDCHNCHAFTIGRVYGTIGITSSKEPLCVGGERKMEPVSIDPGLFNFGDGHPCSTYSPSDHTKQNWANGAPFKFDSNRPRKVFVVDFSNALPTHFTIADYQRTTAPLDLGDLYVGYISNDKENRIVPIGNNSIPYLSGDTWKRSGIIEIPADGDIQNHSLVVFKYTNNSCNINNLPANKYYVVYQECTEVSLLLKEMEIFIRPMGYYMARLENSSQLMHPKESFITDSHEFTLLVTRYGQPVHQQPVTVIDSYNQFGNETNMQLPLKGVKCDNNTKSTNETGHVTFNFTLRKTIPIKRYYSNNPECVSKSTVRNIENLTITADNNICLKSSHYSHNHYDQQVCNLLFCEEDNNIESSTTAKTYYELPIDGQVYNFYYCIGTQCDLPKNNPFFLYKALLSILTFSDVNCTGNDNSCNPNWIDDVQDYFQQQHHLVYAMRNILDLSNYSVVTQHHNIELLKLVLSKDSKEHFDMDPNYMPTTRNLSPAKRNVILRWLDNPRFSKTTDTHQHDNSMLTFIRCSKDAISYNSDPQDDDEYLQQAIVERDWYSLMIDIQFPPSPLFGLRVVVEKEVYPILNKVFNKYSYHPICDLSNLQAQLQQAVQLEFYTIPLYLTALYSIKEGYNTQAYQAIRDVVMQEMLHMVQIANILIAVGGKVIIDDAKFAPSYPATGLPGHVLRNLTIHLKNYNLIHVHNTFMGIELPTPHQQNVDDDSILYTIGMFYKEIESCIKILSENTNIFKKPKVEYQVKWPWKDIEDKVGTVHIINDTNSAINGIDEIIEQGEGASYLCPEQIDTGLYAHFYQFEELVCQKRLKKLENNSYAFKGDPIIYDELGVYPMIDNPKNDTFQPGSRCYIQAKAFHRVYRNLLRVLQKAFNGEPEKITEAVKLMESLQAHAKRCISTPYSTPYDASDYNCGPVWDYEWE